MWQVEVPSPQKPQAKLRLCSESSSKSQEGSKQRPFRTRMTLLTPSPSAPSVYTQPSCEVTGLPGTSRHHSLHLLCPMNWVPLLQEWAAWIRKHTKRTLCSTETELSLLGWRYPQRSRQPITWMCCLSCYWNGSKPVRLPFLTQRSDSVSSHQGSDTTFTSLRQGGEAKPS